MDSSNKFHFLFPALFSPPFLRNNNIHQLDALKNLQLLSHYMPELDSIISSGGTEKLHFKSKTFSEVLTIILPAIRMLGIQTLLPKSLQYLLRPKISIPLKPVKKINPISRSMK